MRFEKCPKAALWPAFRLQNEVLWGQPRAASLPTELSCRSQRPELAETVFPLLPVWTSSSNSRPGAVMLRVFFWEIGS